MTLKKRLLIFYNKWILKGNQIDLNNPNVREDLSRAGIFIDDAVNAITKPLKNMFLGFMSYI